MVAGRVTPGPVRTIQVVHQYSFLPLLESIISFHGVHGGSIFHRSTGTTFQDAIILSFFVYPLLLAKKYPSTTVFHSYASFT